jgi:hypothetical protein
VPSSRSNENATPSVLSLGDLAKQNRAQAVLKSPAAHVENLAPVFTKNTRKALLPLFASITKKGTSADDVKMLLDSHEEQVRKSDKSERERRKVARVASDKETEAAKTSNKPGYKKKRQKTKDDKRLTWQHGVDHLARFVKHNAVDGLVHAEDGVDYTDEGSAWILTNARAVHLYFHLRLEGKNEEEAATTAGKSTVSSARSVRDHAAEHGDIHGFHETKSGRHTRKNVLGNPHLMFAMKACIEKNQYKVGSSSPFSLSHPVLSSHSSLHSMASLFFLACLSPFLRCLIRFSSLVFWSVPSPRFLYCTSFRSASLLSPLPPSSSPTLPPGDEGCREGVRPRVLPSQACNVLLEQACRGKR